MTTIPQTAIGLAPMEGITDFATRLWYAKASAPSFCWTPFYRVTMTSTEDLPLSFAPELESVKSCVPYNLIPQLMTGDASQFCKVAERLLKTTDYVDLNCGCPSSTVVGHGAGSSALESTEKFSKLVSNIYKNIGPEKLSVKMRLGFYQSDEILSLVASIREIKLKHLTIHGRTRPQRYTGKADWSLLSRAASLCAVPVVGSGDIFNYESYLSSLQIAPTIKTRIVGRGAVRNPWIFSEITNQRISYLSLNALVYSLASFAKLQELQKYQFDELISLVRKGIFMSACNVEEDLWQKFFQDIGGKKIRDFSPNPQAFSRLKMLWNHLRTSLPERFWEPGLLRFKNFQDFVEGLHHHCGIENENIPISHHAAWDWLFSGEKRSPPPT